MDWTVEQIGQDIQTTASIVPDAVHAIIDGSPPIERVLPIQKLVVFEGKLIGERAKENQVELLCAECALFIAQNRRVLRSCIVRNKANPGIEQRSDYEGNDIQEKTVANKKDALSFPRLGC